jgi:hypothetical protein
MIVSLAPSGWSRLGRLAGVGGDEVTMSLSDGALGWVPTLTALLLVVAALLVVLRARSGRAGGADSWERSEERRRRKESVYGSASYVLLFCCAASRPRSPSTGWSASDCRTSD